MVYCGKPSKSCRQCRKRNIKCDKKTPSCGQCLRANFQCPGYHNPNHLVFRNETQSTIQKVTEREELLSLLPSLGPSVFDRAKLLFVTRHVLGPSSRLNFLGPFRPPKPCDTYLVATVEAVMFASFFKEVKCLSVLQRARKCYSSALVLVKKALESPEVVAKDVTIATVLLLDLFERFTTRDGGDEIPMMKHLQGAIAIFKLRGAEQFADSTTMAMFRYLSFDFLLCCLRFCRPVPKNFLHLRDQAYKYTNAKDGEWQFTDLMVRLAQLKVSVREGSIPLDEASMILHELDYDYSRILHESPECLCDIAPENDSSYSVPKIGPNSDPVPGPAPLNMKHVALVRNWLDELLQENISCQPDIYHDGETCCTAMLYSSP